MLSSNNLTRTIGARAILDAVSFEIAGGSTTTILGPSGSGKTTLLRAIMGLDRPDAGELHLGNDCLDGPHTHVPAQHRDISLVFQEFTLFPNLNVIDNLGFGLRQPEKEARLLDSLLEVLEIAHLRKRYIDGLSGGEQQRVALARALAVRPRVLLMDEPFSNIDNMLRDRLYGRLRTYFSKNGMTTLIATHDHKEAFFFSDTIMVLRDGRLIDHNAPQRIYEQPANAWVAEFFGQVNLLDASTLVRLLPGYPAASGMRYLLRPEAFDVSDMQSGSPQARVIESTFFGPYQDARVSMEDGPELQIRCSTFHRLSPGDIIGLQLHSAVEPHALPEL